MQKSTFRKQVDRKDKSGICQKSEFFKVFYWQKCNTPNVDSCYVSGKNNILKKLNQSMQKTHDLPIFKNL